MRGEATESRAQRTHSNTAWLLRDNDCVVSAVLPVEVRSALRRRVSEGTLDATRIATVLKRFTADRAFWTVIAVSGEVLAAAETLSADIRHTTAAAALGITARQIGK